MERSPASGKAVCLGGGTGVIPVARGLHAQGMAVAALVATTDEGRSTGLARRLFNIPAPGDLRHVIAAFASDPVVRDLLEYRLDTPVLPALTGAAFGNLVLGVLTKITGSFEAAVHQLARLASATIEVVPLTTTQTTLCAELEDGTVVRGEVAVRQPGKAPIRSVFLDPPVAATERARQCLLTADLVTLGPGSLFTSVLACLAVDGVRAALAESAALRVALTNTTTQPGQSDALSLADQIEHLLSASGGAIDVVLVNRTVPSPAVVARHQQAGRYLLQLTPADRDAFLARGVQVVEADLAEDEAPPRQLWQKEDAIRHEADKVGAALVALLRARSQR